MVKAIYDKGQLNIAAAHMNPTDGAVFIFDVEDKNMIDDFVINDPYVTNKLVTNYEIKELAVAFK